MEDTPIPGYRYLVTNRERLGGKPTIRGTRFSASFILWPRACRTRTSFGNTRTSPATASPRCSASPRRSPIGTMWLLDVNLPTALTGLPYRVRRLATTRGRQWRSQRTRCRTSLPAVERHARGPSRVKEPIHGPAVTEPRGVPLTRWPGAEPRPSPHGSPVVRPRAAFPYAPIRRRGELRARRGVRGCRSRSGAPGRRRRSGHRPAGSPRPARRGANRSWS